MKLPHLTFEEKIRSPSLGQISHVGDMRMKNQVLYKDRISRFDDESLRYWCEVQNLYCDIISMG